MLHASEELLFRLDPKHGSWIVGMHRQKIRHLIKQASAVKLVVRPNGKEDQ